jgi:hypothetical protein
VLEQRTNYSVQCVSATYSPHLFVLGGVRCWVLELHWCWDPFLCCMVYYSVAYMRGVRLG